MKHYNIIIKGEVYQVGFRFYAMQMTGKYNLTGYVKYLGEDTIYMEVEGNVQELEEFIKWCKRGCVGSKIESVNFEEASFVGYSVFKVEHSRKAKKGIFRQFIDRLMDDQ
jgi:acylphosphatase